MDMWQVVEKKDWPLNWATSYKAIWQNTSNHCWLTHQENTSSSLWRLIAPWGDVLTNQLDLPLAMAMGPPFSWAETELKRLHRKLSR